MDPRARCDVVTLLPPLDASSTALLPGEGPPGAPTVAVVAHASAAWRFRDVRVTVDAPWTVGLARDRARAIVPSVVVALIRGEDGVAPLVARALAEADGARRLCVLTRPAERAEAWETLVERDLRERVTAHGGDGDGVELRWLPPRRDEAIGAWHEALDALALPAQREAPADTEGRLTLRDCGCVVSTDVRLTEGAFPSDVFDRPITADGVALRAPEAPPAYPSADDGPWIYLSPADVRGLRVRRGAAHGCCGWYPVPEPIMVCAAHRRPAAWACNECSMTWYVALRARDVAFAALRPPDEPDEPDEATWDGVG